MKKIKCCLDCTDRYPACHDSCEKYIAEKAEYDAEQEIINKKRRQELELNDYAITKHEEIKKAAMFARWRRR